MKKRKGKKKTICRFVYAKGHNKVFHEFGKTVGGIVISGENKIIGYIAPLGWSGYRFVSNNSSLVPYHLEEIAAELRQLNTKEFLKRKKEEKEEKKKELKKHAKEQARKRKKKKKGE